jgi:hypothetical protein
LGSLSLTALDIQLSAGDITLHLANNWSLRRLYVEMGAGLVRSYRVMPLRYIGQGQVTQNESETRNPESETAMLLFKAGVLICLQPVYIMVNLF